MAAEQKTPWWEIIENRKYIRGGIEMESLSKHNNPSVFQTQKHMIEQGFWFGVKESKSRCKEVTTRAGKWMKLTFCEGPWHQSLQGLHQFEQPLPAAAGTAGHPEQEAVADGSTPALFSPRKKQTNKKK